MPTGPMWGTRWLRPPPAGSPAAPSSARSCSRLWPGASVNLGQPAAWAALAGQKGLVFHLRKACKVCKPSAPRVRVGAHVGATATGRAVVLSPPGSRASRSNAHPRAQEGLVHARCGAPCGERSGCCPWCHDRRECPVGVGDSHGPYERPAHSRRAPRARTIRAWGLVGLVRPRVAHREERAGVQ
eukprot:scaffold6578_cov61-Phaeocystis_antarctica.AAC.3